MFFASAMKDACFIRRTKMFAQMKFLIVLIIQIQVFILVSGGYVDFNLNSCTQPPVTPDKNYFVKFSYKEESTDAKPGQTVPENAIIISRCNKGYALDYESEEPHETISICKSNSWQPSLPKCKRICTSFSNSNFLNFNMTCYKYFGGPKIPCTGLLLEGAVVKPRCQQKFRPDRNVDYDYATFREDGNWDKEFFNCIPECGVIPSSSVSLIANGYLEKRGGAPWNLVIYSIRSNPEIPDLICGGTLINEELAISAAHCFYDETYHKKLDIGFFYAVVGKATPDFNVTDYPTTKTYRLRNIYFPDVVIFEGLLSNYAADIVILQLSEKVTFSQDVLPACLHSDQRDPFDPGENVIGKLSGFGVNADGSFPSKLLSAHLPYISYAVCKKNVRNDFLSFILSDKFCAGSKNGTGARRGDSGGGLLFIDEATGLYHLRGVVSNRDLSDSSIATFTDVAQYMYWIVKIKNTFENEAKSCKCNPVGSSSLYSSCDSETMKCQCKAFVTGTNCDTCRDGYWKLQADNPDGCVACGCSFNGSHSSICDKIDGSCQCKPDVIGKQCDKCADNRKVFGSNGCKETCKCNPDGSSSSSCDSKITDCQCKEFVTGANCDTCRNGYWDLRASNSDGCSACVCSSIGSHSSTCDKINGSCQCKPGVNGRQCDKCADDRKVIGPNGCEDAVKWVKFAPGNICLNAVGLHNATDRRDTLLIARHQSNHKLAMIPRSGSTTQFSEYEVLCGGLVKWIKVEFGPLPPHGAISTRSRDINDPWSYYICTVFSTGFQVYGEVQADGTCSYSGKRTGVAKGYSYVVPMDDTDVPKWEKFSHGEKCSNAVTVERNLYRGDLIFLRYKINASSDAGKLNSTYRFHATYWKQRDIQFDEYEVLCGGSIKWGPSSGNTRLAPQGAVVHRSENSTRHHEQVSNTYYVCRALADDGSMVVGERFGNIEPCIISYGGREIRRPANQYDILVQQSGSRWYASNNHFY